MRSTFGGLNIGISAIAAQQRALDITGHNISNVNTPGYSRQAVMHTSSSPDNVGMSGNGRMMQAGTGVEVQEIRQYMDEFLDNKLRRENKESGYWSARQASVEELEAIFNDNSQEGLQDVMNTFWNSWSQLSKTGGGLTARAQVKESAIAFVETVKNLDKLMENFRKNKDNEIRETVAHVNSIAKRIAELNYSIKQAEGGRATANDFRDERNSLINELSRMANIQVISGRTLNIALEGRLLVSDTDTTELTVVPNVNNKGYAQILWKNTMERIDISGGSIKSMIDTRDALVDGFKSRLNEFVKGVAGEINNLHHSGYGNADITQRYMFLNATDNSAVNVDLSNIMFNTDLTDVNNIAVATSPPPGNYEDNRNALRISEWRLQDVFSDDKYEPTDPVQRKFNFDEYYRNLIAEIGEEGSKAITAASAQQTLVEQVENRRQSVMAVSLDEEMSNLIKYEHSYNAAARIVNAMDEMLDAIVNKIGLGGR